MRDLPRQELEAIVKDHVRLQLRYKVDVRRTPSVCELELLRRCGSSYRVEINVLGIAQRTGVVEALRKYPDVDLNATYVQALTDKVVDAYALQPDAAQWAVESWALALGKNLPPGSPPAPAPPAPVLPPEPFESTWRTFVFSRPQGANAAEWEKIGETPGTVSIPVGHDLGVRFLGVHGDDLCTCLEYLDNDDKDRIRHLDLRDQEISDKAVEDLCHCLPDLKSLYISSEKITDKALTCIGKLTGLTTLHLDGCIAISNDGLGEIATLTELVQLDLSHTQIANSGLSRLTRLSKLHWLDLSATSINNDGLVYLRQYRNLITLNLSDTGITDDFLHHLGDLTNLEKLHLAGTGVNGVGFKKLKNQLRNLDYLDLSRTVVTDTGVIHLQALENLSTLDLSGTGVTEAGLAHLHNLSNLERVYLHDTQLADLDIEQISRITSLSKLRPRRTWRFKPEGTGIVIILGDNP